MYYNIMIININIYFKTFFYKKFDYFCYFGLVWFQTKILKQSLVSPSANRKPNRTILEPNQIAYSSLIRFGIRFSPNYAHP